MSPGETTLATRLAELDRAMRERADVRHRDLIPRALFVRVASSLTSFVNLADSGSERRVGVVERADAPWDDVAVEALRSFARRTLGERILPIVEAAPATPECPMLVLVELSGDFGTARLYLDPAAIPADVGRRAARPDPEIPLAMSVGIGATSLSLADLTALEPDDLITLDDLHRAAPIGAVRGVPRLYELRMERDALLFVGATEPRDPDALEDPDAFDPDDSGDDGLDALEEARVTVRVEVARIATTVGELASLVPGSVLAAGMPEPTEVTLRVGGRAVARGELTTFEGAPAVRITEVRRASAR